ncbi:MAG: hypothetical protein EOP83_21775 [Verrucomicrobiaceae bacterium]|nr:MAG: hypothetical protein EOP83_21775 [Verrucomicrobiaceae bacterium]
MACIRWKERPWWLWVMRKPNIHRVEWWMNTHFRHGEVQEWLKSDEATGYYVYESCHCGDDHYAYCWAFSDKDTAFAFKMRFG